MKHDPGSNYDLSVVYAAASVAASTVYTTAIDHAKAQSGAYIVSCGTFATSFVATLQSSPDNSVWTDEPDALAGNDISLTLTEASAGTVKVPNPRARYSRLKIVLGGTCVFSVAGVAGPKLNIEPPATV